MREFVNIPLVQILTLVAFSRTEKLPKGWSERSCLLVAVLKCACVCFMTTMIHSIGGLWF
jgi:hypothetical protein